MYVRAETNSAPYVVVPTSLWDSEYRMKSLRRLDGRCWMLLLLCLDGVDCLFERTTKIHDIGTNRKKL